VLVCASGKRSLAAARELRKRGLEVRSLAGGLQALNRTTETNERPLTEP
jgi:rhodanese-related sulfurtransferase